VAKRILNVAHPSCVAQGTQFGSPATTGEENATQAKEARSDFCLLKSEF